VTLLGLGHVTLLVLAVVSTVATLLLLFGLLRSQGGSTGRRRRDRRGRSPIGALAHGDPGGAIAVVGDALAATHDPSTLLPIILEVVFDATGARGGRVVANGDEVSWIGETHGGHPPLMIELVRSGEDCTNLFLYPSGAGFPPATRELAEWLASQAAVALENARLHHLVQRQAITDDLTGLANRRHFLEVLAGEITRATAFDTPLSVIVADVDDFKLVNDVFGHHVGDEVLRRFSKLVADHLRDVDVAARLGGEEFAMILPDTEVNDAAAVAERVRVAVGELPLPLSRPHGITATFGVAQHAAGETRDDLVRRADAALYRGKSQGKNTVAVESLAPS
jgi:diguanylate cyclase (GGDEF)-like protein